MPCAAAARSSSTTKERTRGGAARRCARVAAMALWRASHESRLQAIPTHAPAPPPGAERRAAAPVPAPAPRRHPTPLGAHAARQEQVLASAASASSLSKPVLEPARPSTRGSHALAHGARSPKHAAATSMRRISCGMRARAKTCHTAASLRSLRTTAQAPLPLQRFAGSTSATHACRHVWCAKLSLNGGTQRGDVADAGRAGRAGRCDALRAARCRSGQRASASASARRARRGTARLRRWLQGASSVARSAGTEPSRPPPASARQDSALVPQGRHLMHRRARSPCATLQAHAGILVSDARKRAVVIRQESSVPPAARQRHEGSRTLRSSRREAARSSRSKRMAARSCPARFAGGRAASLRRASASEQSRVGAGPRTFHCCAAPRRPPSGALAQVPRRRRLLLSNGRTAREQTLRALPRCLRPRAGSSLPSLAQSTERVLADLLSMPLSTSSGLANAS
jgi:hypothetical protein